MAKYTFEFKLKLVKEYLLGKERYSSLARKHGLNEQSAKGQIKKWVNAYKQFGEEGLMRKRKNEIYSVQFKLDAVE